MQFDCGVDDYSIVTFESPFKDMEPIHATRPLTSLMLMRVSEKTVTSNRMVIACL